MSRPAYRLRGARAEDLEPMMRIAFDGIRPWVEAVWGSWDADERQRKFRDHFVLDAISIVQVADRDVGYIKVEREDDHFFLAGIYIAATHRNRGLGAAILADLLARCARDGLPLRLRVLRPNPARQLYERCGFRVTGESDTHFHMEAAPGPKATASTGRR